MNQNWPRWIFASASKHFSEEAGSYVFTVQGEHRELLSEDDGYEFRLDGPYFSEVSKGYWQVACTINVLVQHKIQKSSFHTIHSMIGQMCVAFTDFELFKYGNGTGDDSSIFGCMRVVQSPRGERIVVSHFGRVDKDLEIYQATINGEYITHLKG